MLKNLFDMIFGPTDLKSRRSSIPPIPIILPRPKLRFRIYHGIHKRDAKESVIWSNEYYKHLTKRLISTLPTKVYYR